ncbi:MAG TPA: hypothetical protein VIJ01_08295 [Candidatus Angelobacter sp.]|jgi:hypothetical protein
MNIKLHIERLVLDGLPVTRAQSTILKQAVESELSRLVIEGGIHPELTSGGALAHVPGASMEFDPSARPAALGAQIAQAAYKGFGK